MAKYKVDKARYRDGWELVRQGCNIDTVIAVYGDEETPARLAGELNDAVAYEVER